MLAYINARLLAEFVNYLVVVLLRLVMTLYDFAISFIFIEIISVVTLVLQLIFQISFLGGKLEVTFCITVLIQTSLGQYCF